MILQIDMGNSRIKWRLRHESRSLAAGFALREDSWSWLQEAVVFAPDGVQVSSVLDDASNALLIAACKKRSLPAPVFAASQGEFKGLCSGYTNPAQLGVDRWLVLIAARARTTGACVVVDSGSALTVDVVDEHGRHLGGYIAPGVELMRRGLTCNTAALTGAVRSLSSGVPGKTTLEAMDNALWAMGVGLIAKAQEQVASPRLFLTGGDAHIWLAHFDAGIFIEDMVLEGLECYFTQ